MTPMEAFRGRSGVNSSGFVARDSDEIEELEGESDFVVNLDYETILNSEIEVPEVTLSDINQTAIMDLEYRNRYVERMQRDADVHYHAYNLILEILFC